MANKSFQGGDTFATKLQKRRRGNLIHNTNVGFWRDTHVLMTLIDLKMLHKPKSSAKNFNFTLFRIVRKTFGVKRYHQL